MKNEPNKITATLKVAITGEFYDDEASEETLRHCVEQDLEDVGFDVDVELLKEQEAIVRCKDCKYSNLYCTEDTHGEWLFECCHPSTDDNTVIRKWNWYCADGER